MKKLKNLIALILSFVMVLCFVACSNDDDEGNSEVSIPDASIKILHSKAYEGVNVIIWEPCAENYAIYRSEKLSDAMDSPVYTGANNWYFDTYVTAGKTYSYKIVPYGTFTSSKKVTLTAASVKTSDQFATFDAYKNYVEEYEKRFEISPSSVSIKLTNYAYYSSSSLGSEVEVKFPVRDEALYTVTAYSGTDSTTSSTVYGFDYNGSASVKLYSNNSWTSLDSITIVAKSFAGRTVTSTVGGGISAPKITLKADTTSSSEKSYHLEFLGTSDADELYVYKATSESDLKALDKDSYHAKIERGKFYSNYEVSSDKNLYWAVRAVKKSSTSTDIGYTYVDSYGDAGKYIKWTSDGKIYSGLSNIDSITVKTPEIEKLYSGANYFNLKTKADNATVYFVYRGSSEDDLKNQDLSAYYDRYSVSSGSYDSGYYMTSRYYYAVRAYNSNTNEYSELSNIVSR